MADDDILSSKPVVTPPKEGDSDTGDIVSRPPGDRKMLENAPDDTTLSGTGKNLATSTLKGLSTVAGGMEGDIIHMGRAVAASALAKMPWEERSRQEIEAGWKKSYDERQAAKRAELETRLQRPDISEAEKRLIQRRLEQVAPPTTEEVYQARVAPKLGEYEPTTMYGRFGRAAVQAAIPSMVVPGLAPLSGAAMGTTAGLATQGATELGVEDPLYLAGIGAAGGSLPSVVRSGVQPIVKAVKPVPQAAKELEAGRRIVARTSEPETALQGARARQGLPDEPLAEATLDPLHARTQDVILSTGQPDLLGTLTNRRTAQNAAMLEKLRNLGPIGSEATDVTKGFAKHLDTLNAELDQALTRMPQGLPANEAGAALRQTAQAAADRFHEQLTTLKKSIPDMPVWTEDLGNWVRDQQAALDKRTMKARSPIGDQMYDLASKIGRTTNLHDLIDLDQSVSAMMKKANSPMNADSIGHAQLVQLKGQIKQAMDQALENQHKLQQEAVARGELAPEATYAHNLQRVVDEWRAQRQQAVVGADHAGEVGAGAGTPTAGVPGVGGTERPQAGRSPDLAGDQGVPGDTAAATEKLKTFNKGWGLYRDVYGKGEVGSALERPGIGGQYDMTGAEVANKAFASGPKGYENVQMWLRAGATGGDQAAALNGLKDVALGRLQAELKGKFDPATVDKWRAKYADALRAIDEAEPGWSKQFDSASQAHQAVKQFETGAAQKFLKLEHPDDIVANVGRMMNSRDSAQMISTLVDQAKTLPDGEAILGGLRRAGATALENQFRQEGAKIPTERGFEPMIGGARLQKFIGERRNMLDSLFEPEAVDQMAKVAAEIDRSTAVRTMQNVQHGSQTARRMIGDREFRQQMEAALAQDVRNGTQSVVSGLALWESMKGLVGAVRGQGVEGALMGGLMLGINQAWQRALARAGAKAAATQTDIMNLVAQGFASREVGAALMERALNEHGIPNQRAFDALARALVGSEAASQERPERAAGGRIGGSVDDMARKMVEAVEHARKQDVEATKPLLKTDDSIVAKALEIAGRDI